MYLNFFSLFVVSATLLESDFDAMIEWASVNIEINVAKSKSIMFKNISARTSDV